MRAPEYHFAGYEILGELGRGSTGIVYKALNPWLKRLCALKVILPSSKSERIERRQRFLREAQALALLTDGSEPNIPALLHVGQVQDEPFCARELVDGSTLAHLAKADLMSLNEGINIVATIADTIKRIHDRGFFHRNVHPSNVLIAKNRVPKLIGFGLIRMKDGANSESREVLGIRLIDDLIALQRMVRWICKSLDPDIWHAQKVIDLCEATKSVADLSLALKHSA